MVFAGIRLDARNASETTSNGGFLENLSTSGLSGHDPLAVVRVDVSFAQHSRRSTWLAVLSIAALCSLERWADADCLRLVFAGGPFSTQLLD